MMGRPRQLAVDSRAVAIGLVLLAHALLFVILLFGMRSPSRGDVDPLQFVSLWPDLPASAPASDMAELLPPQPRSPSDVVPSLPTLIPPEDSPAEAEDPAIAPSPPIDWEREGREAAKRAAQPAEPGKFTAGPEVLRKPCEPPKSSFVWNPETPRAGFTRTPIPLPFVRLGERCIVGLGFFGCTLGALPEAGGHLFDDVKQGRTVESSVPDPNVCD